MRKIAMIFAIGVIFAVFASQSVSAETYTVKKGDNLWNISEEYDISVSELMDINELDTVIIRPDQKLSIYETYEVEKGDTLSNIAKDYSVTVEELKDWNDLTSDLIFSGQILTVHKAVEEDQEKKSKKTEQKSQNKTEEKPVEEKTAKETTSEQPEEKSAEKTISVTATAYTAQCEGCSGVTYTGVDLNKDRNAKVIAVDPNVIPLGSEVHVEGYGRATAADIGGAIKGNKIDIHVPTKDEAYQWGVRTVDVTILN